jgi:serine/threonine protein kinase
MVFPYMDHDLAGLLENERVKLQPSHIKLYMRQLLEGTAYMHRVSSFSDVINSAFTTSFYRIISSIVT